MLYKFLIIKPQWVVYICTYIYIYISWCLHYSWNVFAGDAASLRMNRSDVFWHQHIQLNRSNWHDVMYAVLIVRLFRGVVHDITGLFLWNLPWWWPLPITWQCYFCHVLILIIIGVAAINIHQCRHWILSDVQQRISSRGNLTCLY